jgi:hypothetical protein
MVRRNSTRIQELPVNMQKLFEKSENAAVSAAVALFIVFHFGMLYLFDIVRF